MARDAVQIGSINAALAEHFEKRNIHKFLDGVCTCGHVNEFRLVPNFCGATNADPALRALGLNYTVRSGSRESVTVWQDGGKKASVDIDETGPDMVAIALVVAALVVLEGTP